MTAQSYSDVLRPRPWCLLFQQALYPLPQLRLQQSHLQPSRQKLNAKLLNKENAYMWSTGNWGRVPNMYGKAWSLELEARMDENRLNKAGVQLKPFINSVLDNFLMLATVRGLQKTSWRELHKEVSVKKCQSLRYQLYWSATWSIVINHPIPDVSMNEEHVFDLNKSSIFWTSND